MQQVKRTALEAQAHQDLPFEQLVEALQPQRSLSHSPLFQVMYNHQNAGQGKALELPGLRVEALERASATAQFDLTLDTYESGDALSASLIYATSLFERSTVERLAAHWRNLLEAICREPARRVGELPLLDRSERDLLLARWDQTGEDYPSRPFVHQLVAEQARRAPEAIAVLFGEQRLSYGELDSQANRLAQRLVELGVGPEVRVAIAMRRSAEIMVAFLAVLKAGGAYVPLDIAYPAERLRYMLEDCGAALVLTQRDVLERLPLPAGLASLAVDDPGEWQDRPEGAPEVDLAEENLAYVIYTSGSTGLPKGVAVSHGPLVSHIRATGERYETSPADCELHFMSFAFDGAHEGWMHPLINGARVLVRDDSIWLPEETYAQMHRHGVTIGVFPPVYLQQLAEHAERDGNPPPVRVYCFGGDAVPQASYELAWESLRPDYLFNGYGPTETVVTPLLWKARPQDPCGAAYAPIGTLLGRRRAYVLGADLDLLPLGLAGELYLGGEGVARGYLDRPALTAERFVPDPYGNGERVYRSGDLTRARADGLVDYLGRVDHQVKIRGFRIELGEIEARLLEQECVREAVVLARDGASGKQLVGYVVPQDVGALEDEKRGALREVLKSALKASLPEYMVPTQWVFLAALPLTPNGKLDRKALPAPDASESQQQYVAPVTELERTLAAIWADVLKLERVGMADNFFELGGDSIISLQLVSRARQAGIRFTPKDLFQYQTIQGLAGAVRFDTGQLVDQGPVLGSMPLMPIQQRFFEEDVPERHHWNQSLLLEPSEALDPQALQGALAALVEQHDALRLRYMPGERGWQAEFLPQEASEELLWERTLDATEELEEVIEACQRSLDLRHGPLLRALLATLPDGSQRLLLVVHHLVVDGVSWRILLEDLQQAYQALATGEMPHLPAKTSSFKAWAERVQEHARGPALKSELAYWQAQLQGLSDNLPCDNPHGRRQLKHAAYVGGRLEREWTRRLLQQAPAAYRTQINDLLLTALARVVCRWSGEAEVLVRLEGHGREDLFEDIDLSRTVGWFTSLYPLRLSPRIDLVDSIKTIKEQIRAVPNKGIGYGLLRYLGDDEARTTLGCLPEGQLVFNYLGQFDGSFDQEQGLFVPAREGSGAERSDEAVLDGLLALSGQVYDGELSLQWTFSREVFEEATIQRLADEYLSELQALVAHCCEERNRGLTPSDFPLADIDQARLDSLPLPVGSIADLYPLSPMQQGMLFHSLYEEGAGDYINQMQVEVEGLDVARFRLAWEATLEAHDVLRSGFVWEGELGRPLQVVHKSVSLPFAEHDWRGRTDLESALEDLADQERLRTFDLQQAPLLRWVSVRVADHRHRLIYTNHHILMDGWSGSLLLGEVLERYSGRQPAPQAGRYRDYIAWLQRQDRESAERYWKERLAELDAPTRLAQAIRCELLPASGHGHFVHAFDPVSTQHFEAFARTQRVTLNTLVQSAWLLLLQRYTGQDTVCFGATVAGRPMELPGIEQQVGLFINTLPVIASPRADLSVVDWISQVQDCNLGLREYEHTPLYEVQRWAGQGGEGLFDSLLVFENYPVSEALEQGAPSGLRFGEVENREQTNYPLTLSVGLGETLQVQYSYDRRYLDSETVERLASHWRNLLEAMCRAPEIRLGELRMLDEDERQRYLALGCDMDAEYPRGLCLHTLFEAQAGRFADAPAVLFDGELLTYGELNRRANRLAHYLLAEGVGTESLVGIAMERGPDMLVGLLAVLKAGAAYVPLDPDYPRERLAYMLEDSGVRLVLSQSWLSPGLPLAKGVAALDLDRTGWLDGYPSNDPLRPLAAENLAYVIYTSGSTGRPKGVQIEHRSLLNFLASMAREPGCTSSDRLLQLTSLSFDIAGLELYLGLTRGACIVMPKAQQSKDPQALLALIEEAEVSIIQATPATWRMLLDGAPERAEVLRGRKALCGGEALGGGLARRLLAHVDSLWNVYGPTETTIWSSCQRVLDSEVIHLGGPIGNTALHVLDDELEPMPAGGGGELLIGGDGLARGYFARPALTAERFVPNPFDAHGGRLYRTGDLASRRSDGVIDYLGRVDHQVKIRGFRIELGEIEARLQEQGLVREAVVLAQEGAHGAQLVGYVVPITSELAPDWRDVLRNALKGCLPEYMVPAQLVALERLPLTPNGKIDRKALPKPDAGAQTQAYAPPQTEAEKDLARLWREVLGVERVGLHDNFFELGGDSILAVQLVGRIRLWRAPGLEISLRDLMHKPTIAALLESRSHAGSPLVSLNRGLEQVPPLFCIHGIFGTAFDYLPLARRMEGRRTVIGIQSPLLSGYRPEGLVMRELARQYAGLIRQRQPQGPYSLMGWSLGAVISLFVARELEKQGEEVVFLGLADAPLVDGRGRSDQELGQVLDEFLEIFLGTRSRLPAEASVDASVVASHIRAQVAEKPVRHGLTADELIGVFETVATLRKLCWDAAELAGLVAGAHCWWVEGREAEARQFQAQMSFTLARETFCQAEHDTIMQDERLLQELDEASERSLKQRT
nr:non-ribosomal peptide synthetase [Pseudomonas aeruginosa]